MLENNVVNTEFMTKLCSCMPVGVFDVFRRFPIVDTTVQLPLIGKAPVQQHKQFYVLPRRKKTES